MKRDDLHQLPDLSALLEALAATAAQRDSQGGHPAHEKALIARLGLLPLVIPTQYGGAGASWMGAFAAVRAVVAVDSSLGHLLAFRRCCINPVARARHDDVYAQRSGQMAR
ncbi:putative FMNH2-dependent monooxygenase SfnC [Ralstonia syzygii subsp. syzygii]|nr:putative FMNH2-dependent monooxygenase SfnC [Ralstonia syzygii subsp. syzygii]